TTGGGRDRRLLLTHLARRADLRPGARLDPKCRPVPWAPTPPARAAAVESSAGEAPLAPPHDGKTCPFRSCRDPVTESRAPRTSGSGLRRRTHRRAAGRE